MRYCLYDVLMEKLSPFIFVLLFLLMPVNSWAHGFAGKRFFPTTLAVEDPFVSDELSVLLNQMKEAGEGDKPPARSSEVSLDYSKRITQDLGVSIGEKYRHMDIDGNGSESGFGNLEVGAKYQFLTSEEHEAILSFGMTAELGGTGTSRVGAESFSVISPALFFGKGFGDLPESVKFLRPLAVTGVIGPNIPTQKENITVNDQTGETVTEPNPITLSWEFTVQYSLQYLQSFVKDVGLGTPFNRMVVLTEFPLETCMDQGCNGQTTGTVNPGFAWVGKYVQLGVVAQIPINEHSGEGVGVLGLAHFFIDDIFPNGIGRPIFP